MKKILICILLTASVVACNDEPEGPAVEHVTATPALVWDGTTIPLGEDNGWSLSRTNQWIAVTNYTAKSQYVLRLMDKTLSVALDGHTPKTVALDSVSTVSDGVRATYTFTSESKQGTLTIEL